MSRRFELSNLPPREGPRPETSAQIPHVQLDQLPGQRLAEILFQRINALDYVAPRQSRMAAPNVHAFWIPDTEAKGPKTAFIDDHEFCHLHCAGGGYVHLTLPRLISTIAIDRGWAELHLLARAGMMPETTHFVYAPRNTWELDVVVEILTASRDFARGLFEENGI